MAISGDSIDDWLTDPIFSAHQKLSISGKFLGKLRDGCRYGV